MGGAGFTVVDVGSCRDEKSEAPGAFFAPGQIQEGARRALLHRTRFGALAMRGCVLPDATLRGIAEFRPHDGTVPTVSNQELLSEVSSPGSVLPVGSGAPDLVLTCLQFFRVGTVPAWTAPVFGWSLATRYGSRLLPLRLRSLFAIGRCVLSHLPSRSFCEFCQFARSP